MKRFLLDEVYGTGVSLGIDSSFYEHTNHWRPMEDVDWDNGVTAPKELHDALATVATQFHFGSTTDILLCGRIMEREPDMDAKRLSLLLSTARIRNVDAWGRYLDLLETTTEIVPPLEEYMSSMYDDSTDPLSLLIGMSIVGDITGTIILEQAEKGEEQLLQQMAGNMIKQRQKNLESAVNYLKPALNQLHPNRLTKVRQEVRQYRQNLRNIVLTQEDAFCELGWNPQQLSSVATTETDIFLNNIFPQN